MFMLRERMCVCVINGIVYRDRSRSAFLDTKSLINL
jgi:hypothetical protein